MTAALAATAAVRLVAGRADEPSLKDVLHRMSAYVQAYGEKASIFVATEHYTQHVSGGDRPAPEDRITVADFAIVRAEGLGGWVGFRDVLEADGVRIGDHRDRLLRVLSSGGMDEARRLSDESARFNIGPILRNFNVPTTALFFFRPENLERFRFTRKLVDPDGTWEIAFRETNRPTLIHTPEGARVPIEGTLRVNSATGTVIRTVLRMSRFGAPPDAPRSGSAEIDVTYRLVPALGTWLPEKMTEAYEVVRRSGGPERTVAEAKYSDYRQFQTSVRIK
jgi:hypothetical protein